MKSANSRYLNSKILIFKDMSLTVKEYKQILDLTASIDSNIHNLLTKKYFL